MKDTCKTIELKVTLQENGIIRLPSGRLIARLCDEEYDFKKIKEIELPSPKFCECDKIHAQGSVTNGICDNCSKPIYARPAVELPIKPLPEDPTHGGIWSASRAVTLKLNEVIERLNRYLKSKGE